MHLKVLKLGQDVRYMNYKRMAVNAQLETLCRKEGVKFMDLWLRFIGKKELYMQDGLHLTD